MGDTKEKPMTNTQLIRKTKIEKLPITIYSSNEEMGRAVALEARHVLQAAISANGVPILSWQLATRS